METRIFPNKPQCRICLKSASVKLLNLYRSPDPDEESPRALLSTLGIILEDEHCQTELPKQICKTCNCELNLSFQFVEKAMQAQSYIEQYLSASEHNEMEITEPKPNKSIEQFTTKISRADIATQKNMRSAAIVETIEFEGEECSGQFETSVDNLTDDKSSISAEVTLLSSDTDFESKEDKRNLESAVINIAENCIATKRKHDKDVLWEKEIKLPTKQNEKSFKKLSKRGRKPKTAEVIKCHVCEICGNTFTKRGRLTEHLKRHDTEAKYACELCDERFFLREALRRHMFQHLGGKPFKCDFCSRTFFYESVKKAHEAIHAGHKPYICPNLNCNKAFAYPHALKKHQLIHDDVKLFSCTFCKKEFRLQHHLKQHEKTKAHINALQTTKFAKIK